MIEPGVLLAGVEAEGHRRAEAEGRILAPVIVERGLAHLDRAVLRGVERLQAGNDFTRRERLNLELVVGRLGDKLAERLGAAEQGVERLREARGHAPFHFRRALGDRRHGDGGSCGGNRFHTVDPPKKDGGGRIRRHPLLHKLTPETTGATEKAVLATTHRREVKLPPPAISRASGRGSCNCRTDIPRPATTDTGRYGRRHTTPSPS